MVYSEMAFVYAFLRDRSSLGIVVAYNKAVAILVVGDQSFSVCVRELVYLPSEGQH